MATTSGINQGPGVRDVDVRIWSSYAANQSIKTTVAKILIQESIGRPTTVASLDIVDSAGILDHTLIGAHQVSISYTYGPENQSRANTLLYSVDGITNVDLNNLNQEKRYRVNLVSPVEASDAASTVVGTYNGSSTDVIKKIWKEYLDKDALIFDVSTGKNNGRFIAPRLSPLTCIGEILFRSFDQQDSPLFLYEFVNSYRNGKSTRGHRIESWDSMMSHDSITTISPFNIKTQAEVGESSPGTPRSAVIVQMHSNMAKKVRSGIAGKTVRSVDLGRTSHSESTSGGLGDIDDSLLETNYHFNFPEEKQLLSDEPEDTISLANCISKRAIASSVIINNWGCNAIPGLIPGHCIDYKVPFGAQQAGKEHLSQRLNGKYVVSGIDHEISAESGNFTYVQHIQIMRGA